MKKRVAIFANTSWNIYNFRLSLINVLKMNNFDIIIIVPDHNYIQRIKAKGVDEKIVVINNLQRESVNPWNDIKLVFELRKILKKEKIDLVLTFTIKPNIYTSLAALFTPTKIINTVTGLGYSFLKDNFIGILVKYLYRIAFLRSNAVVFQNNDDKELFVTQRLVSKEKVNVVFGSGVDTDKFRPIETYRKKNDINFLFLGRILKDKGIEEFIEASKLILKEHHNVTIDIVGDIDSNPSSISLIELENMIISFPQIKYHDHKENVIECLNNADIVVLPSYREGLPKVIIEALSVGKPVIVTNTAGCRDTVTDGENGFLVTVKSIESLESAMRKMINLSSESLKKMGEKSRKLAIEKFDEKIVTGSYLNIIQSISKRKRL